LFGHGLKISGHPADVSRTFCPLKRGDHLFGIVGLDVFALFLPSEPGRLFAVLGLFSAAIEQSSSAGCVSSPTL